MPKFRLRLRFLFWSKWRLPCLRRNTLPVPVILNRLDTAFRVLAIPPFLVIEAWNLVASDLFARCFSERIAEFQRNLDLSEEW